MTTEDQRASNLAKAITAAARTEDDWRTVFALSRLLKDAALEHQTQRIRAPKTRLAELIFKNLKAALGE